MAQVVPATVLAQGQPWRSKGSTQLAVIMGQSCNDEEAKLSRGESLVQGHPAGIGADSLHRVRLYPAGEMPHYTGP